MRSRLPVAAIAVPGFIVLSLTCVLTARQVGPAAVPTPFVTGPIPATARVGDPSHGYRFFSTTVDLASHRYVEQEFFFEGTANRYDIPAPDDVTATATVSGGEPVQNPDDRSPAGVATALQRHRLDGVAERDRRVRAGCRLGDLVEHIVRRGYAWIGVSAQRVGVHQAMTGLKAWSPVRYGTLDVTKSGTITDDALCYDIYSQAARAVRHPSGVDPMGGLAVKRMFAIGVSQGAARLVGYLQPHSSAGRGV